MKVFKTIALASALACLAACGSSKNVSVTYPPASYSSVEHADSVVTGVGYDSYGEPLISAAVQIVGQKQKVATDLYGKFTLKVSGPCKIKVYYIGYYDEIIKVKPGQNIKVTLRERNDLM